MLRAKGVLRDIDGTLKTLHLIGARFEVTPFSGGGDAVTGIACIGLRGRVNRAAIEHALANSTSV